MATSQYTYHPYHTIGAATVQLWDPNAGGSAVSGAWRPLGKVADAAVIISTEQVGKDLTIKGLTQPIARRNRAKRYSISFRMLEDANPLTLDLLGSEGAALARNSLELVYTAEVLRLIGSDWREVGHPYGIAAEPPEGVSDAAAESGGTGGGIPPGTYFYWVAPYLEGGANHTFEGLTVSAGSTEVAAGEKVTISFSPPGSWMPDGYRIYYNTVDSLTGATLAASGTASPIVIDGHLGSLTYDPPVGPLVSVRDYDGAVEYTADNDYRLDVEKGLVKRTTSGLIPDGAQIVVCYAYWRPASVSAPLGDPVDLERYQRVRLLQLAPDDPDPAAWRETGVEFTFFRVNVSLNDSRWPFSENDFSEGASVTWDCLFDGVEAKVGEARSTYGILAQYE
jgi:hypothetical protein